MADIIWAGIFIALLGMALGRGWAGYSRTGPRYAVLARREAVFLEAAAEVLFPPSEGLPLSGAEADLPGYADRYLVVLPVRQRNLLRALFVLFEHATLVWPAAGRGGFRRFSSLSEGQRLDVLRAWESSGIYLRRMVLTALKAVLILGYVGHPRSLGALGLAPWKLESPRVEADYLYPPIGEGRDRLPERASAPASSPLSFPPAPPLSSPPAPPLSPPLAPPLIPGVDQETS